MVKTYVSMIVVSLLLIVCAIVGDAHVNKQFNDFNGTAKVLYQKVHEENATPDDVYVLQNEWLKKKKTLHAFISHTEIKEFDMWISECVTLVRDKEWQDAISKVEVIIELAEQIPRGFSFSIENIL